MSSSRRYPERPILGVGAVILHDDCVLLVERGNEPLKGWWSLPGGGVETGETLENAIRREIREETCLEVEIVKVVEIFERIMPDAEGRAEYHYVLIDYLCHPVAKGAEACPASDASRLAWVRREDLPLYKITEGTTGVIEKVFDAAATIEG